MNPASAAVDAIETRIAWVHGRPVLFDVDLARIHNVPVRRLRELVSCHHEHFPGELCFQPESADLPHVTDGPPPDAFTEQGVWMTAGLLGSPAALRLTLQISRAFERYRRDTRRSDRPLHDARGTSSPATEPERSVAREATRILANKNRR